ncbi:MAG: SUF system Fe-S cluster assembly regulator [Alphaproteobacteria bacterium]
MIRISKLADYAVVILVEMAKYDDKLVSASALAVNVCLPEPTVSKILKLLVRGGAVSSVRGSNGGYKLSRLSFDITIEDIITAVDGPIGITSCADGIAPDCSLGESCSVRGRWDDVNTAIRGALSDVSLADMIAKKNRFKEEAA